MKVIIVILTAIIIGLMALPVYAIANPDDITFGTGTTERYKIFYNVRETGDVFIYAEGYVNYAILPTDYTANEAFILELRDTTNSTVLIARALESYGDRPISIYLTAAQVTTLGITTGTSYWLRLSGNPLIFSPLVENTNYRQVQLSSSDWINQSTSTSSFNHIKVFSLQIATNMEAEDGATYTEIISGTTYLNTAGANLFLEGTPALNVLCPSLFTSESSPVTIETPESTGALQAVLTPNLQLGNTIGDGITAFGGWLSVSQSMAAGILLAIGTLALAIYIMKLTGSGLATMGVVASAPLFGGWLGLMPLQLAFILTIFLTFLLGYLFLSRGSI